MTFRTTYCRSLERSYPCAGGVPASVRARLPPPDGGNCIMRDLTRRRHAASQRLMLQNPHTRRHGRRRVGDNTGRSDVAALKPTTPLQPLTRASMKPPSPLRAPEQQPLKPLAPLQPKNTPKTPISHPQRRCRFQLAHLTGPQRRWRFHTHTDTSEQRRWRFQTTTHMVCRLPSCHQQAPMRPLLRKLACNSIG